MYVIRNPIVALIAILITLGGTYLIVTKVLDSTEKQTDKITRDVNTQVDKALTNAQEQRKEIEKATTDASKAGSSAQDAVDKSKKIQADLQACIKKAGADPQKAAACSQKAAEAAGAASP